MGGIAGKNDGTISGGSNRAEVTGTDSNTGGIAGINSGTGVINGGIGNGGKITGKDNVGGIAGKNDGTISGGSNWADVTGTGSNTGGVAGNNTGTINECGNECPVNGKTNTGGITGTNGASGKVTNNTNSGNVTGEDKNTTGAIIGKNDNKTPADIAGNYYQKTDSINKDLTGIGGVSPDPAGITSGKNPRPDGSGDDGSGNKPGDGSDGSGNKPGDGSDGSGNKPGDGSDGSGNKPGDGSGGSGNKPGDGSGGSGTGGSSSNLTPEQIKQINDIMKKLGVTKKEAEQIQKIAQQLNVDPETLLITDSTITKPSGEKDIKGTTFRTLQLRADKVTASKVTLKWKKVKGADGYMIYGNSCNKKLKLLKTVKKSKTSFTKSKLKKGSRYKYVVRAYKKVGKKKITIAASKTVHINTRTKKYGNVKSVKVNKTKVTIKKGKTFKIKAKAVKELAKLKVHRNICYESSNKKVATVSTKGVIKGKKKGTCTIYVYAQNGKCKTIKVTVK